jgi:hypothetical protein
MYLLLTLWLGFNATVGVLLVVQDAWKQLKWKLKGFNEDQDLLRAARIRDPEQYAHMDTRTFVLTLNRGMYDE